MNIIDERDKRNRARRRMKEQYDSAMTLSVENRWYRLLQEGMITYSDGSPYFYIAKGTIRSFYDSLDPTYEGSINIGHTDLATFPERIVGKWTKADLRVVDIEDGRQALETTLPVNTEHPLIQALSLSPFDVGLSVEMRMNVNDAMTRNEAANPFGVPVVDEIEIFELRQGIQGISDLIAVPAMINLDFADVKTIMKEKGMAHMGIGTACGEKRASEAAKQAVESPLLETSIDGAKGILMNITGGPDLSLLEVNEAAELIQQSADPDANIIFGADIDESMGDALRITVIATGFDRTEVGKSAQQPLVFGSRPAAAPRAYTAPQAVPVSAENAFSARPYAQLKDDDVPAAEPEQKKESTFTEQDIRREYTNRPANKLDIPAFLRK